MMFLYLLIHILLPGCHKQLRIIVKPKQCVGVGPLCSPEQVNPGPDLGVFYSYVYFY